MYAIGKGVQKNLPKAIEWFMKAIEEDNTDAMCVPPAVACAHGRCPPPPIHLEKRTSQPTHLLYQQAYPTRDARPPDLAWL